MLRSIGVAMGYDTATNYYRAGDEHGDEFENQVACHCPFGEARAHPSLSSNILDATSRVTRKRIR